MSAMASYNMDGETNDVNKWMSTYNMEKQMNVSYNMEKQMNVKL